MSALALAYGFYVIAMWLAHSTLVSGWSSTIVIVSFLCGVNMLMTGIVGLYVGRIYNEVKHRPLYVVDRTAGFAAAETAQAQRGALEDAA